MAQRLNTGKSYAAYAEAFPKGKFISAARMALANQFAPAIADVISGQVPIIFDGLNLLLPHIQAGKLVPLAVIAPQRLSQLPHVPTLTELGFSSANRMAFNGIVAPKGTPPNVVATLSAVIAESLNDPAIRNRLEELSAIVLNGSGTQLTHQISDDLRAYQQLAKQRKLN